MNIKQQLFYLDNPNVLKSDKYKHLEKLSNQKLEELYSECIEKKVYVTLADDAKISYPEYPNAIKILLNAIELRQYAKPNQKKEQIMRVTQTEKQDDFERRWLQQKAEQKKKIEEKKQKQRVESTKQMEKNNQNLINRLQEIISSNETATVKVRNIRMEVKQ